MTTRKWVEQSYDASAYVDGDGRILGIVRKGWRAWTAYCEKPLGDWIDEASARGAVERADKRNF